MHADADRGGVRLAELVAALSLGIDLGFGQPMEHVLRQCLIALRLAESLGLDEETRVAVYYTALLVNIGCHTDAHEQAKWFGDDIALKADKYDLPACTASRAPSPGSTRSGPAHPVLPRFRIGLEFAVSGHKDLSAMIEHHSKMARTLGEQLGLPEPALDALDASYEQWDGKGWPGELNGEDVPIAARLAVIGEFTEVAHRSEASRPPRSWSAQQSGKQFDPHLAAGFVANAEHAPGRPGHRRRLERRDRRRARPGGDPVRRSVRRRPAGDRRLHRPQVALHPGSRPGGRGSGGRRRGAARDCRKPRSRTLRRAGLVHDFGRLGVSNSIWDKPGPLGAGELERVRMAPYLTERILRQSPALAPLGAIAVQHRERLDGSGYPRGLSGGAISQAARLLGAADAYQAMREPRPYREALSPDEAAAELRAG